MTRRLWAGIPTNRLKVLSAPEDAIEALLAGGIDAYASAAMVHGGLLRERRSGFAWPISIKPLEHRRGVPLPCRRKDCALRSTSNWKAFSDRRNILKSLHD